MLNGGNATIEASRACTPDPEEMLQSARTQKEKAQKNIDRFKEFAVNIDYLERDSEQGAAKIIGELMIKLWTAEANEQRWLDEIDKSDD